MMKLFIDRLLYLILIIINIILLFMSSPSHAGNIVKNIPGFDGDLPFTLETGYVGVGGEGKEVELFYYFVESGNNPLHDPLLLYFAGGPGASGLFPLIVQIGPLSIKPDGEKLNLELNPNSWAKTANVVYLDIPAGAGFSYGKTDEAWKSSDSLLAEHAYEFILMWLEEHPRFRNNPLYITGVSYMGIVIPLITSDLYKGNERGHQPKVNIKGCIILSPLTDKFSDFNSRFELSHRLALISDDIYKSTKQACHGNYIYNDPENTECSYHLQRVDECTNRISGEDILGKFCDELKDPHCNSPKYMDDFGNNKEVQNALHVREGTIKNFVNVNETIHYFFNKKDTEYYSYNIFSSLVHHKSLISKNCQVLILSGDHDFTFPHVGIEEWITSLNLPIISPWKPWFVNDQVAGYRMKYEKDEYSLTYATVKGAGHSIPIYKPEEVSVILDGWLASHAYFSDS